MQRALTDEERGLGSLHLKADADALAMIADYSSGDARNAYNALEMAARMTTAGTITKAVAGGGAAAAGAAL